MSNNKVNCLPEHEEVAMDCLASAWNSICNSTMKGDDLNDFRYHIHALQNLLMGRQFARNNPSIYSDPDRK